MLFWDNIAKDQMVAFMYEMLHHLRGRFIAQLGSSNTHKGVLLQDLC